MVLEKSGRPPGSILATNDQYLYPFSDLQFTGNKIQPKDAYRLIISASDGTTFTRSKLLLLHLPLIYNIFIPIFLNELIAIISFNQAICYQIF